MIKGSFLVNFIEKLYYIYYDIYGDNNMVVSRDNNRGYRLMFYDRYKEKKYLCFETSKIEEIDYFTSHFADFNEMIKSINKNRDDKYDVSYAYIERVGGKFTRYMILYRGNLFDYDKVIYEYKNYLLSHPDYFNKYSPVKSVNLCFEDYSTYEDYVSNCCYAYFLKRNYRDIRGAYVELKNLGLSKRVLIEDTDIDNEFSEVQYRYSGDEELDDMLNCKDGFDWDKIYSLYDREDIDKLEVRPSSRGRRQ